VAFYARQSSGARIRRRISRFGRHPTADEVRQEIGNAFRLTGAFTVIALGDGQTAQLNALQDHGLYWIEPAEDAFQSDPAASTIGRSSGAESEPSTALAVAALPKPLPSPPPAVVGTPVAGLVAGLLTDAGGANTLHLAVAAGPTDGADGGPGGNQRG